MAQPADHLKHSFKTRQRNTSLFVVSAGFQRCLPGYGWGPGVRDHYLLHYVQAGRGQYTLNGETYQVVSGELFLIRPNVPVHYQADLTDPWDYVWVGFDGHDAPFLLNQTGFSPGRPVLAVADGAALAALMLEIYDCRGSQVHEVTRMTGLLYQLLAVLIGQALPDRQQGNDAGLAAIRTAADFIAGNYSRPITVDEIAAYAGVSRSVLYRGFRNHLGISPMQYAIRCRIERACVLLRSTDTAVAGVARSVGFEDPLYFSRIFKANMGQSPDRYRRADEA